MDRAAESRSVVNVRQLAGRVVTGFAVVFLLFDAITKLMSVRQVIEATAQLGYPVGSIPLIGALLLGCTVVYVNPRTAVLGAILLTGYLGGATAANLRVGHPLFEILFPVMFAVLVWAGIFLRDDRLSALIPGHRM